MENPKARLDVRKQVMFVNLVADALNDESLGFHLGQLGDLREMGLLYYVLASSDVLIHALQRIARYSSIVNEGISAKCIDDWSVGLSLHHTGVSRHLDWHQTEFWMTLMVRTSRQLTGFRLLPNRVRLIHHRKKPNQEFAEFFGDDVEFGSDVDEFTFAKSARNLTIINADPYLNDLLVTYCEEALSRRPRNRGSFRSTVENAVVPLLPHGEARVGEIARRLGVSQRTLERRLSSEGLTFSGLVESLRIDLAHRYLREEQFSISQIAWMLGYREVSAFSHAFKRWTGKTPRAAQRRSIARTGPVPLSTHRGHDTGVHHRS